MEQPIYETTTVLVHRLNKTNTRIHFFKEFIEDKIMQVKFVSTNNNDSDIVTKDTTEEIYKRGTEKMIDDLTTKSSANYKEGC